MSKALHHHCDPLILAITTYNCSGCKGSLGMCMSTFCKYLKIAEVCKALCNAEG